VALGVSGGIAVHGGGNFRNADLFQEKEMALESVQKGKPDIRDSLMGSSSANNMYRQVSLLLVQGSEDTTSLIRESLAKSEAPFSFHAVASIAEARRWLDENTPDLVITDLHLPEGKGTLLLPFDKSSAYFPVIFTVDPGNEAEVVGAIKAGAMDYILKTPEALAKIAKVIERALRQWGYVVRQRLTEDALRESEERFRSIFQTAAAGMVVISTFNNILQVNPAFCTFTGYSENELLNSSLLDITHPDDSDRILSMYDDLFSLKSRSIDCERRYIRKDGSIVWGHVSVACILGGDGRPAYAIALVQDINMRKALEEQLLQANMELDAFAHTVSHDLRSPLTPIIGYVQFIQEQYSAELPPEVNEMLSEVLSQGERMHLMLEDLLTLATVGKVDSPSMPVSGEEVIKDILMRFPCGQSSVGEVVTVSGLPDMLISKTLYLQILDNLVGNALQYAGGRQIEVSGERKGSVVLLKVRDHGSGIPDEEKTKIFELFYRGVTGRKFSGTGIGLATVKKIAKIHNGLAWVEDAPGGGSIFIVELKGV
jgi:PAS domain S-box-containing protein